MPEPALDSVGTNQRKFIRRHRDQRRSKHRDQRDVLERIVQDCQEIDQIQDLLRCEKPVAFRVERNTHRLERFRIDLQFSRRSAKQMPSRIVSSSSTTAIVRPGTVMTRPL